MVLTRSHANVEKAKKLISLAVKSVWEDTKGLPTLLGFVLAHSKPKWGETKDLRGPKVRGQVWLLEKNVKPTQKR